MTMIKVYDFGGSNNREGDVLNLKSKIRKVSSKYKEIAPIGPKSPVRVDVQIKTDDFIVEKSPWEPIVGKRYVKPGAFGMHKGAVEGTDNQENKSKQNGTYINAAYMMATAILREVKEATSEYQNTEGKVIKIYEVDDLKLGVCIPAGEFYSSVGAESIKDGLAGTYSVRFPVLNKIVRFKIARKDISVSAEGVVGLYVLFKTKWEMEIKKYNIIILDGGYRSLDVTVLKKFAPDGGSSRSFPVGGITLEALVSNELERDGIFITNEDAVQAIETGFIDNNSGQKAVGEFVQRAKKILARRFHDMALEVMNVVGMYKRNIRYLAPVGRCFEVVGKPGEDHYTGDLMEYIIEMWGEGTEVLPMPNLEEANINGLLTGMRRKYQSYVEVAATTMQEEDINHLEDNVDEEGENGV